MCAKLSPNEIRYSQDSISNTFYNGETLDKVISTIIGGKTMTDNMTKIAVFKENGKYYACDNRKLYVLKEVQRRSKPDFKITAKFVMLSDKSKFTTKNDGASIRIRCPPPSRSGTVGRPNGAKRHSRHNNSVMDDLAEDFEHSVNLDRMFGSDLAEDFEHSVVMDSMFGSDLAEDFEQSVVMDSMFGFDLAEEIECANHYDDYFGMGDFLDF